MASLFFCCKRRPKKIVKNPKDIKLDLNMNKIKHKDTSSIEMNQSQSMSMLSNNLNNSTKDNIFQKQNKFNIVNVNQYENKLKIPPNNNIEKCNNVIYNIINVDNINNNNINSNKKNMMKKDLSNNQIISIKEEDNELSEREKKLFEKENELSNKEKEINNKILELIQRNRKLNESGKKPIQKNSVINDVIKFKKVISDFEENNNQNNNNNTIKTNEIIQNKEIIN